MDTRSELLDAVGVRLAPGQRVVYATAGMHATGRLSPGTVVSLRHVPDGEGPRERIGIRRNHGQVVYIRWSKRVVVLRQESEAEGWLRSRRDSRTWSWLS
jgi:hypothetical protein